MEHAPAPSMTLPVYTKETLIEWADKIDSRLGPISGRDADALARLLRATAARLHQLTTDRNDQDRALADAIRETAASAEEIAFWRFQAFWHRAQHRGLDYERADHWKQLEADFERIRVEENKDRYSVEDSREIGS